MQTATFAAERMGYTLLWLLIALAAGLLVGRGVRWQKKSEKLPAVISTASLLVLLFAMGAQIGANDELLANIRLLGLQAVLLAAAATFGSILCVFVLERTWWQRRSLGAER